MSSLCLCPLCCCNTIISSKKKKIYILTLVWCSPVSKMWVGRHFWSRIRSGLDRLNLDDIWTMDSITRYGPSKNNHKIYGLQRLFFITCSVCGQPLERMWVREGRQQWKSFLEPWVRTNDVSEDIIFSEIKTNFSFITLVNNTLGTFNERWEEENCS